MLVTYLEAPSVLVSCASVDLRIVHIHVPLVNPISLNSLNDHEALWSGYPLLTFVESRTIRVVKLLCTVHKNAPKDVVSMEASLQLLRWTVKPFLVRIERNACHSLRVDLRYRVFGQSLAVVSDKLSTHFRFKVSLQCRQNLQITCVLRSVKERGVDAALSWRQADREIWCNSVTC
ncbi:hypothetical protein ISREJYDI_CDS0046 [Pseudomonas phage UNO-G1W1]|uniref:Uncharacterized protein n=1 Tax=Pseudomonas phage UNO-G1W1 TaxID=3136609 RepID=A0AAX4QMT8_9CAUD